VLTISKLKRWSINYYLDTAATAERASKDRHAAGGGLGEYYSEHETRTPVWMCAGDTHTAARLVGLSDVEQAGGVADATVVARWLDDGVAPNGLRGRGFGERSVHGFDLTFCAPKSVSLVRAVRADPVLAKAVGDAHATAMKEAMQYLSAHAGYTRVHNPVTGEKDLVGLRAWWASRISTKPRGAGIRTCTPTSSSPTAKPALTECWCRSMGRRCITKPARPA
jgi:conjugative relaxase-like TrwC/TraI family protein